MTIAHKELYQIFKEVILEEKQFLKKYFLYTFLETEDNVSAYAFLSTEENAHVFTTKAEAKKRVREYLDSAGFIAEVLETKKILDEKKKIMEECIES